MDDPQAIGASKALRGIDIADLQTAYRQFCKNETVARPAVDLGDAASGRRSWERGGVAARSAGAAA
jgi:hypothetical protein